MNKPNNYDNTRVSSVERVTLGGHYAKIMEVIEMKSRSGKQMIKVSIDFDQKDAQADYIAKLYKSFPDDKKTWPYQAVHYIMVEDAEGNTNRSFKSFINSYEASNDIAIKWGSDFGKQFKGKLIGVVYGEEEDDYSGQVQLRTRIRFFCDYHRVEDEAVPEVKRLKGRAAAPVPSLEEAFMTIPDGDELPFN